MTCRRCGSTDVMRMPRTKWEQALPLAAFSCRKCGRRFHTERPAEGPWIQEAWLIPPLRRKARSELNGTARPLCQSGLPKGTLPKTAEPPE